MPWHRNRGKRFYCSGCLQDSERIYSRKAFPKSFRRPSELAARGAHHHPASMFVITEAEAAAIRAAFEQEGELSAAVELRRCSPPLPTTCRRGSAHASLPDGCRCRLDRPVASGPAPGPLKRSGPPERAWGRSGGPDRDRRGPSNGLGWHGAYHASRSISTIRRTGRLAPGIPVEPWSTRSVQAQKIAR